jgi:simple sugar transport system permease protein
MSAWLRRPWVPTAIALAVIVALASARYDGFFSAAVLVNLLDDGAVLGLAALGATLVIASGGIDLAPGAMVALSSTLVASLLARGTSSPLAFAAAVLLGIALGAGAGALIDALELPAFIVTLGAMFLARGAALALHVESLPIRAPAWEAWSRVEVPLGAGLGLDLAAVVWLVLAIVAAAALRHSRTLRNALAIGGDERTAVLFGVPTLPTRTAVYALGAGCSALAGVAYTLYSGQGDSTAGVGLELDAIAAVVIGGTALSGGSASLLGTVLGVLLLGVLQTMLVFEGVPGAGWTRIALGALLLVFVVLRRGLAARVTA